MPWQPRFDGELPSLGWGVLEWCSEHLPSPRDPSLPLVFTDSQAMQIVEWYRLNPRTGRRVYQRGFSRRSKGRGKSPTEAAKAVAEFRGPVRFAGWDAHGRPVGRPWGSSGDPRALVQIGATSEDQTANTWGVIYYFLTENDGKAADALGIDAGLTRCYLRDQPGAMLEPVTAAAISKHGAPLTYGVLDETHLWTPSNGGVKLAKAMRNNATKMDGTTYETTNAFLVGDGSVAEDSWNAVRRGAKGIYADDIEAPRVIGGVQVDEDAPDDVLLAAVEAAYGDTWWQDFDRIVQGFRDPSQSFEESARFFLNWNQSGGGGWVAISREDWAARAGDAGELVDSGRASLAVADGQRSAALGFAGIRKDGLVQVEAPKHEPGTGWIVAACQKAQADTGQPIWYDPKSATAGVVPELEHAGVLLHPISPGELAAGSVAFQNLVIGGGMVHLGSGVLNEAVRVAEVRRNSESWVFSSRQSAGDISALQAVVIACMSVRAQPVFAGGFVDLNDLDD